jgi:hypothetical protein
LDAATSLAYFSPRLSTNAEIVWNAPTDNLPGKFWFYRRKGRRVFPASVISNAVILASLQNRGFPKPSTKDFIIWEDRNPNYRGGIHATFGIRPGDATIYYGMPHYNRGSRADIPSDSTLISRAWNEAARLGIDLKLLKLKELTSHSCDFDENGNRATNLVCGRGVYLSRQLDGIIFNGSEGNGWIEGFWIEFGSQGQVRGYSLTWPDLVRYKTHQTASPEQIMDCVRAQKVVVKPNRDESSYFARIEQLASMKKLTIAKVTPYYSEGEFGEEPGSDVPAEFITPFAELEAAAEFETNKADLRIYSPIVSSEAIRLLENKANDEPIKSKRR